MNLYSLPLALAMLVSGCGLLPQPRPEPVEIKVPVPVRVLPPAGTYARPAPGTLPVWTAPGDAAATSCLTPEGERLLKALLAQQEAQRQELEAWATSPEPGPAPPPH